MKRWLCAIGLALSIGCATAVVRPYVGDQQTWPTASGSIVNTSYALPVFVSLPPVPYDVLAEMRISSPFFAVPEEGHMPRLVKRAQEIGADALVFVQGRIFFSTSYGPRSGPEGDVGGSRTPTLTTVNTFNPDSFSPEVTILAVRWIGDAPPGLPSHRKSGPVTTKPSEPPPAPLATEVAPQPPPAAEPPATNAAPAAPVVPSTGSQPANPSGQ